MNALSDYAYQSNDGAMLLLLLILGAIITYILFSKGFWLDRFMQDRKWEGEVIEPHYQEGTPFTPALEKPFDDPEVPNRPLKKKAKPKPKKKRVYKRRKKK